MAIEAPEGPAHIGLFIQRSVSVCLYWAGAEERLGGEKNTLWLRSGWKGGGLTAMYKSWAGELFGKNKTKHKLDQKSCVKTHIHTLLHHFEST